MSESGLVEKSPISHHCALLILPDCGFVGEHTKFCIVLLSIVSYHARSSGN